MIKNIKIIDITDKAVKGYALPDALYRRRQRCDDCPRRADGPLRPRCNPQRRPAGNRDPDGDAQQRAADRKGAADRLDRARPKRGYPDPQRSRQRCF